jgi:ATP-binding cassette subfamily C protein CydD
LHRNFDGANKLSAWVAPFLHIGGIFLIDKALFRLEGSRKIVFALVVLAILQAVFIIGQAVSLATAITRLWEGRAVFAQFKFAILFLLFFVLRNSIIILREKLLDQFAYASATAARKKMLHAIFKQGPKIVQKEGTGNTVTTTLEGISEMENYIQLVFSKVLNMMIVPIIVLTFIFCLNVPSGVILLIVFPVIILFMIILGYAAQSKADSQFKSFQILSNHFIDSMRGLTTLRIFGLSKPYANAIYKTSERFRKATMSTMRIAVLSTFALDFFTTLSIAVVAVFLGLNLMDKHILLFPALTILILCPEYFLPLRDFAGDYHATLNGKNAMANIQSVIDSDNDAAEAERVVQAWCENSQLVIDNMTYHYEENATGISDFFIEAIGYTKIGVIGASGSGKSTLINLLGGFLKPENTNAIEIDGKRVPNFDLPSWQKGLHYIPQTPYLFHGTIRENICFYLPDATDESVLKAVQTSGLSEFIEKLPDGLATIIGEGGRAVSGGQAQRLALARAFLSDDRKVLLLDEPTAHLDIETEMELKETILPLMENKLVFLATHRLHWMKQMDKIIVLNHGEVDGVGTHEELLHGNAYYQELVAKMRGEVDNENLS